MRRLPAIDLVAHLATRVIDQDLALTALDKHHKVGDGCHQHDDDQCHQNAHRTGTHQLEQATHGAGQAGGNARKNEDGDPVAQSALSDLLAQPHQKHSASRQTDHCRHAESKARCKHQTGRTLKRHGDAHGLENSQTQSAVPGVLRDLAPTGLALLLELLKRRHDVGQQLHDDGG